MGPVAKGAPLGCAAKRGLARRSQPAPQLVWDSDAASDDPIEDQLARLAGAFGPLRRLLAAIAERLIKTTAHQRLCYARLRDYARERLGLSARQLQKLARVHRALAGLPALERALLLRAGHSLAWARCQFHPERAQDPIPSVERQMCAPDIDTTQHLAWRVPRGVAALFFAVRDTPRSRLRAELGLRPGASPLLRYRSGDILVPETEVSPLACPQRAA